MQLALRTLIVVCILQYPVSGAGTEGLDEAQETGETFDEGGEQETYEEGAFDGIDEDGMAEDLLTNDQIKQVYELLDKDHDGEVTVEEVMKVSDEMRNKVAEREVTTFLTDMDTDGDGKLSLNEILQDVAPADETSEDQNIQKYRTLEQKKFLASDQDHDGKLDKQEIPAMFHPGAYDPVVDLEARDTLQGKDQDGDGELTQEEFWGGDAIDEDEKLEISDQDKADFQGLDSDKNGKLSVQELKAWESGKYHADQAISELIRLADKNHDSKISLEELSAVREEIAESDIQYHFTEWLEVTHEL